MEELGTYVNLFRKFTEWEWYKDVPVKTLFLHCLIRANYRAQKYKGRTIERGSFVTSRKNLSLETGLTEQQVRTALGKLVDTKEINRKTTNKETVISVVNYDKYQPNRLSKDQSINQQDNQQATNEQPTNNQQITINQPQYNKDNKYNKENNLLSNINSLPVSPFPDVEKQLEEKEQEQQKLYGTPIIELYEERFNRLLSQRELQIICQWKEEYDDKLLRYAFREMLVQDKNSVDYVDRILLDWKKRGLTAEQYEGGER